MVARPKMERAASKAFFLPILSAMKPKDVAPRNIPIKTEPPRKPAKGPGRPNSLLIKGKGNEIRSRVIAAKA